MFPKRDNNDYNGIWCMEDPHIWLPTELTSSLIKLKHSRHKEQYAGDPFLQSKDSISTIFHTLHKRLPFDPFEFLSTKIALTRPLSCGFLMVERIVFPRC